MQHHIPQRTHKIKHGITALDCKLYGNIEKLEKPQTHLIQTETMMRIPNT